MIVLLLILLLLGLYVIPRWRLKRAVRQVIAIFRRNSALDKKTAKTIDELRLKPRGFADGMFHLRDFKPNALDTLVKAGIIQDTEDGRLYLAEDALMTSGIEGRVYPR
ncbi:MAG: hypothetical protein E3J92_03505 [Dehalococcoidia bacterium]|nr:MAG: hypothetical protein E3J92_03505 [Dehalococcoidia bacterium]